MILSLEELWYPIFQYHPCRKQSLVRNKILSIFFIFSYKTCETWIEASGWPKSKILAHLSHFALHMA